MPQANTHLKAWHVSRVLDGCHSRAIIGWLALHRCRVFSGVDGCYPDIRSVYMLFPLTGVFDCIYSRRTLRLLRQHESRKTLQ